MMQDSSELQLDELSSFPVENYLQTLKWLIRSTSNPTVQAMNRGHEYEAPVKQHKSAEQLTDVTMLCSWKVGRLQMIPVHWQQ